MAEFFQVIKVIIYVAIITQFVKMMVVPTQKTKTVIPPYGSEGRIDIADPIQSSVPQSPPDVEAEISNTRILVGQGQIATQIKQLPEYKVSKKETQNKVDYYTLKFKGDDEPSIGNSKVFTELKLSVAAYDPQSINIKIYPTKGQRWEIPESDPFPRFRNKKNPLDLSSSCCIVTVTEDPFSIKVVRKDNGEVLYDTTGNKLIFSEFYMSLKGAVASPNIYGFGERNYDFKLNNGRYTIWGRDEPKVIETGNGGGNVYGHHPVGLVRDQNGAHSIVYLRNSNGMDVVVDNSKIEFLVVGGIYDLAFFVGDNRPDNVVSLYHQYSGNWTMMPFWSMGNQQSRWGYQDIHRIRTIINKFKDYDIPLDVMWNDLDYMQEKEDFTINSAKFPPAEMKNLFQTEKKKWVPLIDAGVKVERARARGASEGIKRDIFIKNFKGDNMPGKVWPGRVHFPDFFHPKCDAYWADMLEDLYKKMPFDGIWLDMNEIANFNNGELDRNGKTKYEEIPYQPGNRELRTKTISMDAVHYGNIQEWDVHELFSIMQNRATYKYLKQNSELPFILTRSSSPGTGQFSAHWTGDVGSDWRFLKWHISGNFVFYLFGMPFVGADICGFMGSTTPEMCTRWYQLGAFSPFARNHNVDNAVDQEPWAFYEKARNENDKNSGKTLIDSARDSMKLRYSILKWYYSLFLAQRGIGGVFKPLSFEFPDEEILYKKEHNQYNEEQFLLGSGLMVIPGLEKGRESKKGYFPKATWFDYFNGGMIMPKAEPQREITIQTPLKGTAPVFIRGGTTVFTQDTQNVKGIADLTNKFNLTIALDHTEDNVWSSEGLLLGLHDINDESLIKSKCMDKNCLYRVQVQTTEDMSQYYTSIKVTAEDSSVSLDPLLIEGIKVYGLPLQFLDDDNVRVAYGIIEVFDSQGVSKGSSYINNAMVMMKGAYAVMPKSTLEVVSGDTIKMQIII